MEQTGQARRPGAARSTRDSPRGVCRDRAKQGAAHGWPDMVGEMTHVADWFDKYLAAPAGN